MKIVFAGMIGLGSTCLSKLISSNVEIALVITEPAPDNRLLNEELKSMENIRKQTFSEYIKYNYIRDICVKNKIPCCFPSDLNTDKELICKIKQSGADTLAVCTFDKKISNEIISIFKTAINLHPAILPDYAGPAPVVWTIRNNEKYSGVSAHLLTGKMDGGDIISISKFPVEKNETGSSLNYKIMNYFAPALLINVLQDISANRIKPVGQDFSRRRYYPSYDCSMSEIDFEKMTAEEINRIVKAGNFYYPAFFKINNKTIIVWETKVRDDMSSGQDGNFGEVIGVSENSGLLISTTNKIIELIKIQINDKISPVVNGSELMRIVF
ncbi:MAG TPA: formyltransferase family protein [bacterium]|nr:formyltransferase family protein [bacterium]HPN31994.1 formyltransferase family protein [bacterium]